MFQVIPTIIIKGLIGRIYEVPDQYEVLSHLSSGILGFHSCGVPSGQQNKERST